jgi:hypothetical protein
MVWTGRTECQGSLYSSLLLPILGLVFKAGEEANVPCHAAGMQSEIELTRNSDIGFGRKNRLPPRRHFGMTQKATTSLISSQSYQASKERESAAYCSTRSRREPMLKASSAIWKAVEMNPTQRFMRQSAFILFKA